MTVYARMTLALTLLTVVTLGVAFAAISAILDRYQERQLDHALLAVARAEAAEAPANRFSFSARPGPAANDVGPLEKYGVIYDERGTVLAATQPFDARQPPLREFRAARPSVPFDFAFGDGRYRGVVVPVPRYPSRHVLLAASREDLDGDSRFLRRAMAIALAVSVAWLVGAIAWLVRKSMREHRRIAETLHRIASGDVDARVPAEVSDRELRRLGSDIDEIAERLAKLVQQQRRFIAHAAHELRSPLAALYGEIQQALRRERSPEDYRRSLTFLLKASGRLKQLADDLLELARAEQLPKRPIPVSAATTLADVVESLEPLAKGKNVVIERGPEDALVCATPDDVGRILRNLLDNAIRHSPEGGIVRLGVEAGDPVRVHVHDQGPGVPASERESIFEPFYRARAARADTEGAGLGLAIARELARKHQGEVLVSGVGNCFVLSLPRMVEQKGEGSPSA